MGNDICSEARNFCNPQDNGLIIYEYPATTHSKPERKRSRQPIREATIDLPALSKEVQAVLQEKDELLMKLAQREVEGTVKRRQFGEDIYEGELEGALPHGLGKMYKSDGSFFIGKFEEGRAQGAGLYVLPDGAYFEGELLDNCAHCERGRYVNHLLTYEGGFKDNLFSGEGREQSQRHCFEGTYENGVRKCGQLRWWGVGDEGEYCYYGKFDEEGLFTEEGILHEPAGQYTGTFLRGKKHGEGTYLFRNNLKYQGEYAFGVKHGKGKVSFADKEAIIYEGQFKNGLPDGKGIKYEEDGSKAEAFFRDGINVLMLLDPQALSA